MAMVIQQDIHVLLYLEKNISSHINTNSDNRFENMINFSSAALELFYLILINYFGALLDNIL